MIRLKPTAGLLRKAVPSRKWVNRRSLAVVLALAVLATVFGGLQRLRVDTGVNSFLPGGDPSVAALDDRARSFGGDPIVSLLESPQPQQLLLDPQQFAKLFELEGKLSRLPDVAAVYGPATVINQVAISAQNMLAQIVGKRDALRAQAEAAARDRHESDAAVAKAGDEAVAGFDQRYGSLLVQGLPAGLPTTHNPQFVKTVVYDQNGKPRLQWSFVVPNDHAVAILVRPRQNLDQVGTQRLTAAVRDAVRGSGLATSKVTISGVPAITSGLTAEITRELPLLGGLVLLVMMLRFLLVPSRVKWFWRLWPLAAALLGTAAALSVFGWLGIALSFGAIALLPLLLGIGSSFPLYLATVADRRRVLVVSLASAAGFACLAVSPLPFVRELGLALAAGVLLTTLAAVALGPRSPASGSTGTLPDEPAPARPRWGRTALAGLGIVAVLGWVVLPMIPVQANPEDLARGVPDLDQARYAEQVLGSSGEVSIGLQGNDVLSPEALQWAQRAEDAVLARYSAQLRPILTMPDLLRFLGSSPTPEQVASGMTLLPQYLTNAVVRPDGRAAIMIFGLKFQDLGAQTTLLNGVTAALPPPPPGYHTDVAGLPVAADRGYELVSQGRYLANFAGIVAAGLVLLAGLRRWRDAGRAVLAALLATGWTLAGVWLLGVELSPLTIALGSLTTVTACEFTILLLDSAAGAASTVRRTVALACLTSVAGFLTLLPSNLWLLREFSLVLTGTVVCSYLAAKAVVFLIPDSAGRARRRVRQPAEPTRKEVLVP